MATSAELASGNYTSNPSRFLSCVFSSVCGPLLIQIFPHVNDLLCKLPHVFVCFFYFNKDEWMYAVKWFTSLMTKSSHLVSLSLPKFRDRKFRVGVNISAKCLIHDHPFLNRAFFNPKFLDVGHFCGDEVTCFWNRLALNGGIWRIRASYLFHDRFNFYNLKTFSYTALKH